MLSSGQSHSFLLSRVGPTDPRAGIGIGVGIGNGIWFQFVQRLDHLLVDVQHERLELVLVVLRTARKGIRQLRCGNLARRLSNALLHRLC